MNTTKIDNYTIIWPQDKRYKWWAMNSSGIEAFHKSKPHIESSIWFSFSFFGGSETILGDDVSRKVSTPWYNTLTERKQEKK